MPQKRPSPQNPLKIGTRGSPLALAQATETRDRLAMAFDLPNEAFDIVIIKVTGDMIQDRPLKDIGGKGLFTREIEEDLLSEKIDIAVHSMKDMPVDQPQGLILDTYLPREDVRDALISNHGATLDQLDPSTIIGTSSLRRRAQILYKRPDLQVIEFRGNVQTRLRKLNAGVAGCTFLAMAGLNRLCLGDVPRYPIDPQEMLPAVAQGAIGIERREDGTYVAGLLEAIHDPPTAQKLAAERSFLATLDGSCETPIAGLADFIDGNLRLRGQILRPDGSEMYADTFVSPIEDGARLGHEMARTLLDHAGTDFLKDSVFQKT